MKRLFVLFCACAAAGLIGLFNFGCENGGHKSKLGVPMPITPVNNAHFYTSDRNVLMSWSAVKGATSYDVLVMDGRNIDIDVSDIMATSALIRVHAESEADNKIMWQVRAVSGSETGQYSKVSTFWLHTP